MSAVNISDTTAPNPASSSHDLATTRPIHPYTAALLTATATSRPRIHSLISRASFLRWHAYFTALSGVSSTGSQRAGATGKRRPKTAGHRAETSQPLPQDRSAGPVVVAQRVPTIVAPGAAA